MSLLEEVKAAQFQKTCRVAQIAETMGGEDGKQLLAIASDDSIPLRAIVTVLRRRGISASDKTIGRHRRGDCEC